MGAKIRVDKVVEGEIVMHSHGVDDLLPEIDARYLNTTGDTATGGITIQPATDTTSALVVNDQDANNVLTVDTINNRVGIGTTTPGVKLDVTSATNLDGLSLTTTGHTSPGFRFNSGSTASANVRNWGFSNNYNTFGDFAIRISNARGGDPLGATGTTKLSIDINGNVGIGTTSPTHLLQLSKTAVASTREQVMKFGTTDAGNDAGYIGNATSADGNWVTTFSGYTDSSSAQSPFQLRAMTSAANDASDSSTFGMLDMAAFRTNSATDPNNGTLSSVVNRKLFTVRGGTEVSDIKLTVLASGNVGIGITAPTGVLHIRSSINQTGLIIETDSVTNNQATFDNYGTDGNGGSGYLARRGRGTIASPADVLAGDRLGFNIFGGYAGGNFRHTAGIQAIVGTGTISSTSLPTYLNFLTTADGSVTRAERMRIDQNGNVGIGTTGPTAKLHIVGNADTQQLIVKGNATQTTNLQEWQNSSGTVKGAMSGLGHFAAGGVSYDFAFINIDATQGDFTGNTEFYFSRSYPFWKPTNDITKSIFGSITEMNIDDSLATGNLTGSYIGGRFRTLNRSTTRNVGAIYGGIFATWNLGTGGVYGNVSSAYSGLFQSTIGGGTVTNNFGARFEDPTGAGTLTNNYAIYVSSQTKGGTLNYAIYTNAGLNRLGDQLSIVGSADTQQLIVKGNATQTSNLQEWQNSSGTVLSSVNGSGNFGIGTAPTTTNRLNVGEWKTDLSGFLASNYFQLFNNPASSTSVYAIAAWYRNFSYGTQNFTGGLYGQYNEVIHQSTGTLSNAYGLRTSVKLDTTGGNITYAVGGEFSIQTGTNSASTITTAYANMVSSPGFGSGSTTTITTLYGLYVANQGNAKITNAYGLRIADQSGATTLNYALYTDTGLVRFGDNVETTGDMKAATYHVGTDAGVDGTFTTVDLKTVTVKKGIITSII